MEDIRDDVVNGLLESNEDLSARLRTAEAENARLREALERIAGWDEDANRDLAAWTARSALKGETKP
jgi:hypothetical protein